MTKLRKSQVMSSDIYQYKDFYIYGTNNKRQYSVDDEQDSFSECDSVSDEDTGSDYESQSVDDDTIENENQPNSDDTWKSVHSTFLPRMTIPTYKEPEILDCDEDSTIMEIFLKLFPKSLFIWISECTNERLEILSQKKGIPIKATNPDEIMVVIGCLLVMSFNRVPHMWMYWSKNKSVRNETIATAISRDRFMLLHSKLYFNHPSKPNGAEKTYYTSELIRCLIYTFNRYRTEATHQSIDEFMVKFKGRTAMKQYVPIKPVKKGMKGFCRADADTGYVYYFYVYQGQEKQTLEGTLGERVVTTLCKPIRDGNVVIVIDRFFTSVNLLRTLDYACLGTVQSNRKNLPDVTGKLARGQSIAKCTDDGIIFYKWQDTKEVMLLSNCHQYEIGTTERTQKDGTKKTFDCPEAFNYYNRFMAGVDKCDQYSTYYEIDRKSNKWWKRVFYRLLLMTVSNSWILYKACQGKKTPLIDYLIPLAEELIVSGKNENDKRKLGSGPPSKKAKLMINVGHLPIRQGTRRRCAYCSQKKEQVRTYYICTTCEVPLCVDCFAPYHGHRL